MMRLLLIGCLLLLSACASQLPLPEKTPVLVKNAANCDK